MTHPFTVNVGATQVFKSFPVTLAIREANEQAIKKISHSESTTLIVAVHSPMPREDKSVPKLELTCPTSTKSWFWMRIQLSI